MSPRTAAALRDQEGEPTLREHLLATAERLVAERGAAGITVRDIARQAGVAAGVLYNHFADKEELLAHALYAHVLSVEREAEEVPVAGTGTVEENLRAYLRRGIAVHTAVLPAFDGLFARPKVLERFADLPNPMAGGRGLHNALADYLRAEQRLGRVEAGARPEAVATMLVGTCHELVFPPLPAVRPAVGARRSAEVPAGLVDDIVATVLDGIRPR
ncbi:TetR/AcrR family transcriptional regulator [Streptomonospora wellingtoniae]|uniref:Helix-turn-helix domain-containing protein n=1 Tax=Streptomonospora wellingtoniae TaxID=3075544 RepID=A0ABU2KXH2_9ACTN|nr:helix-turn-helix domain-containing protein [Streptomonospora sp. DSM 45055]MDT0304010.1 helix-turn-helix domain-containing protein [Streptomonospora sp. DSM 45055]